MSLWQRIKQFFSGGPNETTTIADEVLVGEAANKPVWLPAEEHPWPVAILDVRPQTQTLVAYSKSREAAENAVSYSSDDGSPFDHAPLADSERSVACELTFRVDPGGPAPGVLFVPRSMDHKWGIFMGDTCITFVRSWTRQALARAHFSCDDGLLTISRIDGYIIRQDESDPDTIRLVDFLLRSHVLGETYPMPIDPALAESPVEAGRFCFTVAGNMVHCATPHEFPRQLPDSLLRSESRLHIATAMGNINRIRQLLADGWSHDIRAKGGQLPIYWATACDSADTLGFWLDQGIDPDSPSDDGSTPLMVAVEQDKAHAVDRLLAAGADVNRADQRGFTALHRAAEMGKLPIAKTLISHGADPQADANGHTPRSMAETHGHSDILALFDQAG